MKKTKKKYLVNIDMVWSQDFSVSATSLPEARQIAFDRFKRRLKKQDFDIIGERIDY